MPNWPIWVWVLISVLAYFLLGKGMDYLMFKKFRVKLEDYELCTTPAFKLIFGPSVWLILIIVLCGVAGYVSLEWLIYKQEKKDKKQ